MFTDLSCDSMGVERERERLEQCSSAPVSILFGHFGGYASAGHLSAKDWWRMAHPSSSDRDDGSKQRAWTKTLRALWHFAADRASDEKLMKRGFLRRTAHPSPSDGDE